MKKDFYAILYVITSIMLLGAASYYVFVIQRNIFNTVGEDPRIAVLSARQEAFGQQITKAALGMGYSPNERNFNIFQSELARIMPEWKKAHLALLNGDPDLAVSPPAPTNDYLQLQEDLKFYYNELEINASNLVTLEFTENPKDVNYLSLRSSIEALINNVRKYQVAMQNVTDFFLERSQLNRTGFSLVEKIILGLFLALILLQGLFVFRPLVKLAGENFLSANKAFQVVKKSEEELKVSYAKQKQINKMLVHSRKELELKNKRLQDSESKLIKSTEEQIAINEQLIRAQEELKGAYKKLIDSEEEIRELADRQLVDNEKLFLAEKKMKEILKEEQRGKEELRNALNSLKSAQSQLVHSEKMASLGQLTAGIAHEINNPINFISSGMNSMRMSIESIKEILEVYSRIDDGEEAALVVKEVKALKDEHEFDELMDELDDLIKDINYGVTRTIEIVKGLRVFSRLDEEESKPANINENIDATLTLLKNKTKNRIKVNKFYDEKMADIECYPGQLNQVFMNILNNSIQAIPEERKDGEITIYTEDEKDTVTIRLKDNGTGIPDEIKARIWEPFFTTKPVGVGTGLGMSITFGIIEKHGGRIDLVSEVGKGTEFIITLPKKLAINSKSTQKSIAQN